jgi:hypothetical protein
MALAICRREKPPYLYSHINVISITVHQMYSLILQVRTTASTAMNDTSSRSHSIFTIKFVHAGFDAETGLPHETVINLKHGFIIQNSKNYQIISTPLNCHANNLCYFVN